MGFNLAVMPILTHTFPLGHLKGYIFGVNPKNVMAGAKGARKGRIKGPKGDKGAKGGLFTNHYDLLAIRNVFHIAHYPTKQTKVV